MPRRTPAPLRGLPNRLWDVRHTAPQATREVAMSISPVRYLQSGRQTLTPGARPRGWPSNRDALGELRRGLYGVPNSLDE
jgi:hypothetical protein